MHVVGDNPSVTGAFAQSRRRYRLGGSLALPWRFACGSIRARPPQSAKENSSSERTSGVLRPVAAMRSADDYLL